MLNVVEKLPLLKEYTKPTIYPGLNGTKGLLILIVVFTHCLPPSMLLYFLYFFHMPLFMSISGYLLKQASFNNGYKAYIKILWHRLILPWLIASLIFIPLKLTDGNNQHLQFADIIYPYYHLWYIPAYIIGATVCYWINKTKILFWPVIIASGIISITWYNLFRDSHVPITSLPLFWFGEKRFFAYLIFFILGFSLRNNLIKISIKPLILITIKIISFALLTLFIIKKFSSFYIVWPYMLFNISLVTFVLIYIAPKQILQNKLLLLINKQSLGIYLYHPLIIISIYILLNDRAQKHITNLQASGVFIVGMALTMLLVWLLKKWNFTNVYLLGNLSKKNKSRAE